MRPRLRLFTGSEDSESTMLHEPEATIKLGELTRILSDAIIWDRTWVSDFADDEVKVSADLYEILSLYSRMKPSA
ncbi:MAG TPA: hypothetical protein DCR20_06700 [Planctomycetaceae bacterium]|nr:hypothetical protein [Planctomycetaceae bacterium]